MKIKDTIRSVMNFFHTTRRVGSTELLKKIADENDVWVLTRSTEEARRFGKSGVSLYELDKLTGADPKPILIDNHVLLVLLNDAYNQITAFEGDLYARNKLLGHIKFEIEQFERESNYKLNTSALHNARRASLNDKTRARYFSEF